MEAVIIYLALAFVIGFITIKEDRKAKKIAEGYNPFALDRDGDGIVQEGTKFERKAKPKKSLPLNQKRSLQQKQNQN